MKREVEQMKQAELEQESNPEVMPEKKLQVEQVEQVEDPYPTGEAASPGCDGIGGVKL